MLSSPSKLSAVVDADRRQPNQLQRHAPSSIQINQVLTRNVAIPLLSPLVSSPPSFDQRMTEKRKEPPRQEQKAADPKKLVFKIWQHPTVPFYYEPSPLLPSFVPA
ncbi:hypothetical protein E1A91_A09G064100v1 [Gossypium mustelinum]|uniref:Uncharacterized protein n=2 Tax=Gossypium TaxID=3633 RepID=A0A2P5XSG6_GOSBA|nr:hypothetical protein ES319_A09G061700v1 [Gossypium barbadense]PPS06273.1 hypothetical protein GOBAR_AA14375 [Gossypium barbadense]TYJ17617.1 hypothetical protein E1A91_A09G064100v1 [Gossypium mustelinum]